MIGYFYMLAIVNNTALNVGLYIAFQISVFIFLRLIPRSGIAGSHGCSVFNLQDLHTVFHWRRKWQPTPELLPRESSGQRSLVGCCHGVAQSQTRLKWLSMHSCIGEGTGNPLQYSCLENPRDWGAWWAAVYGVAQSRTRLKRLSSSISSILFSIVAAQICPPSSKAQRFLSVCILTNTCYFLWRMAVLTGVRC